jgi:hypothetical protein
MEGQMIKVLAILFVAFWGFVLQIGQILQGLAILGSQYYNAMDLVFMGVIIVAVAITVLFVRGIGQHIRETC